ncbi:MAG TPA: MarC family protein [Thermoplasmata archaeon]
MAVEFLSILIPIFIVIDPFGTMPFYIALTGNMDREARRKTLVYAVVFAAALLLVFALAGKAILDYLSISIDALRITGGVLLVVIGVSMLYEGDMPRSHRKGEEEPDQKPQVPEDVAFVPLGTPLLAGPGAISVVIVNAGTMDIWLTVVALVVVMLIGGLMLWQSGIVFKLLGNAGTRALTRVMGLITTAYAVQMILDGVSGYVSGL